MGIQERKQREKEQRKIQIIQSGEKLFLKKGLEGTTMDEIAEMSELSKGTLYLYFNNKEELYLTIILKAITVLYEMVKDNISKYSGIPPEKLRKIGNIYLKYYKKHPNYFKIITHFIDHEMLTGKPEIKNVMMEILAVNEQIWKFLTQIIIEGINEGYFDKKINPMEIATILWTSSNGIIQFMDHIKNEKHFSDGVFHTYDINGEKMLEKTWDIIISSIMKTSAS